MALPGPSFSSLGPVRRAGVSVHFKTYHREPLYASKSHLPVKNTVKLTFLCLFVSKFHLFSSHNTHVMSLLPQFKKTKLLLSDAAFLSCQMVADQTASLPRDMSVLPSCFEKCCAEPQGSVCHFKKKKKGHTKRHKKVSDLFGSCLQKMLSL